MKFYGKIGFWLGDVEVKPGIFESNIIEKNYAGDVYRNVRKFQSREYQNDELTISNQIGILSDLYMRQNWSSIRYVLWNGVKWKVTSVDVNYPRIILELGGVWNGSGTDSTPIA